MAYYWATWLKTALYSDPFVAARTVEVAGWQTRGRPPSQFSFLPSGTLDHHTACMIRTGHDPQSCLNGILAGNSSAPGPVSQLLGTWTPLGVRWAGNNVAPRILIVAAGRSNHAGAGAYPWGAPSGNGSSIGIEWCGPPDVGAWPDEVIELRERVTAAVLRHNGWQVRQATTHWEYATPSGRKIDPSGPYAGEMSIAWNRYWNPDTWRTRVARRITIGPRPPDVLPPIPPYVPGPPIIVEDDMKVTNPSRRLIDSRVTKNPLKANVVRELSIGETASAAMVNILAVRPAVDGYITAWGAGTKPPGTSAVNAISGESIANAVVVPVDGNKIRLLASINCEVVVDLQATWPVPAEKTSAA